MKVINGAREHRPVLSASSLTGNRVVNRLNEDVGKIYDIMIHLQTGRVTYAVLSFGGFMGVGDKLFAIPWNSLELDEDNKVFLLDVDKEKLRRAPGFDQNNWPNFEDLIWQNEVHDFYGSKSERPSSNMSRQTGAQDYIDPQSDIGRSDVTGHRDTIL